MKPVLKRLGLACLMLVLCAPALRAAGESDGTQLRVLATTFPVWLFTRNVAAGVPGVTVELMIPASAGCPHDYGLTPQDMMRLSSADVLVMNGLGLEAFLGATPEAVRGRLKAGASVVTASAGVRELLPYHGEGEEANNPHVFAAPGTAAQMALTVGEGLAEKDPAHAAQYRRNAQAYAADLNRLADEFATLGKRLSNTRIVTQHGDFDYLAREAGLSVEAVVQPHEGQEPSASRMLDLVRLIRERQVGAVFTEPQYPAKSGDALARESGVPVARLDPVAEGPADAPLDYYQQVMTANLHTLERTLGVR